MRKPTIDMQVMNSFNIAGVVNIIMGFSGLSVIILALRFEGRFSGFSGLRVSSQV